MPQYLVLVVRGVTIAQMKTSHRGGDRSHYDIFWTSIQGYQREFPHVDTGVECQPSDRNERRRDSMNDFIHARRTIRAASLTAKQFVNDLNSRVRTSRNKIETVQMTLKTNCYDRGRISIIPNDDKEATLTMEIGTGPCRPKGAIPAQAESFMKDGINISETGLWRNDDLSTGHLLSRLGESQSTGSNRRMPHAHPYFTQF